MLIDFYLLVFIIIFFYRLAFVVLKNEKPLESRPQGAVLMVEIEYLCGVA